MPAFNEARHLERVVDEWMPVLASATGDLVFCLLDDGSTDQTPVVVRALSERYPSILSVSLSNRGHGRACLHGYRLAVAGGARFILQIDSDGQCDPAFFPALWAERTGHPLVFGYRAVRHDGRARLLVSRTLALGVWAAAGVWTRDPNVPYRLMDVNALSPVLRVVPDAIDLVNVYVTAALAARFTIRWVDIEFRRRHSGASHYDVTRMVRLGSGVLWQLLRDRAKLQRGAIRSSAAL
jgi:glycosyltransferase involved in cell wall biosynthesis